MAGCLTHRLGITGQAPGHGANCVFFVQPSASTPVEEIASANGGAAGNAFVDVAGQFMQFDGSGDYYEFAAVQGSVTANWTLEFYLKDMASNDVGTIVCRGLGGGAGRWAVYASGSSGNLSFYIDELTGSAIINANSMVAADGNWHHFAIVKSGTSYYLFKDGVSAATATQTGTPGSANLNVRVGTDFNLAGSRYINGKVCRVKITQAALWTSGFTPPGRTDG